MEVSQLQLGSIFRVQALLLMLVYLIHQAKVNLGLAQPNAKMVLILESTNAKTIFQQKVQLRQKL